MQDNISCALITAFERQYDTSWDDPKLRNERLAMRYGWTAAMEAKQCLHQIQEPAAAEQAAWHAGLDEGRAQAGFSVSNEETPKAAPDERAAFENFMRIDTSGFTLERLDDGHYKEFEVATYWHFWQARAALAATPAAAPVVLPEPDFWVRPGATIHPDRGWQCWSNDGTATGAFHADTVRALLATATGLPAQARSKSGWTFEELEAQLAEATEADPENCRAVGEELLKSIHDNFTALKAAGWDGPVDSPVEVVTDLLNLLDEAKAAAPQAQADARDAIRELIAKHRAELEHNAYAYFELAYTRRTGWMAWITDKPLNSGPVINPDRKVLCSGQGDTPEEACSAAIAAAKGE